MAGKRRLFLPGEHGLVGLDIKPGVRRYSVEGFKYFGLSPLVGDDLPISVGRHSDPIIAKITNPDWNITWAVKEHGELSTLHLANKKGVASFYVNSFGTNAIRVRNWGDQTDQETITLAEIRAAHNLSPVTPVINHKKETEFAPNPPIQKEAPAVSRDVEKTVTLEVMSSVKNVKCQCGYMNPISKTDREKYKNGEGVKITCNHCRGVGVIQR